MQPLNTLIKDPQTLLELQPEELGMVILRSINSGQRPGEHVLPEQVIGPLYELPTPRFSPSTRPSIELAVREAWQWLEAQILLTWPDNTNGRNGWRVPSRRGREIVSEEAAVQYLRAAELPRDTLHPALRQVVWTPFLSRNFDLAIFAALKAVEVAVRDAAGLPNSYFGVPLMGVAFHVDKGPLTDLAAEPAEREALRSLFAGAIGRYKNPHSHRAVGLADANEAREIIMLASHLLRIVDGAPRNNASP